MCKSTYLASSWLAPNNPARLKTAKTIEVITIPNSNAPLLLTYDLFILNIDITLLPIYDSYAIFIRLKDGSVIKKLIIVAVLSLFQIR